jgi:hypothetical protein
LKKKLNQQLSGKVIYLVVCGAKKLEVMDKIIYDLLDKKAKVFVFPTYLLQDAVKRVILGYEFFY